MTTVIFPDEPNLKTTSFDPILFDRPECRMRTSSEQTGILYQVLPVIIPHLPRSPLAKDGGSDPVAAALEGPRAK